MKAGKRGGSRTVVVHFFDNSTEVASAGPRFGLIVSKAVGNAVVRHRTSRRLRHICRELDLPVTAEVVLRALPAAGTASSEQLESDIRQALRKAQR